MKYFGYAVTPDEEEVVAAGEDGRARTVAFELDAGMVADEFTLAYEYAEDLSRIEWHLVAPSKMQRNQLGSYDIADNGDGTWSWSYTPPDDGSGTGLAWCPACRRCASRLPRSRRGTT